MPTIGRHPYRLLAVLALATALAATAVQAAEGGVRISRLPSLEAQTLAAINELRREHGLPMLRTSTMLGKAAQDHSLSMAEHGYFAHSSADGSPFRNRAGPSFRLYRALGEAMAWASPALSARQTVALWLRSPEHRETLLSPTWREVGLGAVHAPVAPGAFGGLEVTIVTVDFGARR